MTVVPIVALDVPSAERALSLVDSLGNRCRFYKVGSELFTAAGPSVVSRIRELGHEIFLDLKLHDIPNTVRGAARSAAQLGASLLTVHASGGESMVRAAAEGAGSECRILGVTVLTSLDDESVAQAWGREDKVSVPDEVLRLAGIVSRAGGHGIVCGGGEAARVHATFGAGLALLIPGIRFSEGAVHDQSRVVTPREATEAGARYIVLGRAVTAAPNPARAMDRVWAEIAAVGAT
ncbi:MAG: orotidine-5'-phosphate decarboxylase [Gemmatimonadaceae bacterium]